MINSRGGKCSSFSKERRLDRLTSPLRAKNKEQFILQLLFSEGSLCIMLRKRLPLRVYLEFDVIC